MVQTHARHILIKTSESVSQDDARRSVITSYSIHYTKLYETGVEFDGIRARRGRSVDRIDVGIDEVCLQGSQRLLQLLLNFTDRQRRIPLEE